MSSNRPDVSPSGYDVIRRLAAGVGPGQSRGNCTAKLERDGLIVRFAVDGRWLLTIDGWLFWLDADKPQPPTPARSRPVAHWPGRS
jgi:hypothetical protein